MRPKNESEDINRQKTHQLVKWTIVPLKNGKVAIEGQLRTSKTDNFWQSTAIISRVSNKTLKSKTKSVYKLWGPINKKLAIDKNVPPKLIQMFSNGFPTNWSEIFQNYWNLCGNNRIKPEDFDPLDINDDQLEIENHTSPQITNDITQQNQSRQTEKGSTVMLSRLWSNPPNRPMSRSNNNQEVLTTIRKQTTDTHYTTIKKHFRSSFQRSVLVKNNSDFSICNLNNQRSSEKNKSNEKSKTSKKRNGETAETESTKKQKTRKSSTTDKSSTIQKKKSKKGKINVSQDTTKSSELPNNCTKATVLRTRTHKPNYCELDKTPKPKEKINRVREDNAVVVREKAEKPKVKKVQKENTKETAAREKTSKQKERINNVQEDNVTTNRALRNRTQIPNYCELNVKTPKKDKAKEIKQAKKKNTSKKTNNGLLQAVNKDDSSSKEKENNLLNSNKTKTITEKKIRKNKSKKNVLCDLSEQKQKDITKNNQQHLQSGDSVPENNTDKATIQPPVILTARKGTKRRKQQLISLMEKINEGYEDDLFESTPLKKKCGLFNDLDISDDEGNDFIQTPVLVKSVVSPVSAKKTPNYNAVISPGAVLQRTDVKIAWKKPKKKAPSKKDNCKEEKPKNLQFKMDKQMQKILSVNEREKETSESEDDFYFSNDE